MNEKSSFFKEQIAKVSICENCGFVINNPGAKNVAHIIPKETFKSVQFNDDNILRLCSSLDRVHEKGCHDIYDSSWTNAKSMKCWRLAVERFNKFKHLIKEKSITILNFEE